MKKKILLAGLLFAMLGGLQLTLMGLQQNQENRSKATAATTLAFTPASQTTSPIQKNVGETVNLDIMVNPGTSQVSTVKLQIAYDKDHFSAAQATAFSPNPTAFPSVLEGPLVDGANGNIYVTVSIGADPTKSIKTETKLGTITLTATAATATNASIVSFGSKTQVLSVAPGDAAAENVLASSLPAYVAITAGATTVPCATPTTVISATATPSPLITNTITPTGVSPTMTPTVNGKRLDLTVLLHCMGNSGDNVNETNASLSNKYPKHPEKTVLVGIYNALNQLVATKTATILYSSPSGNFTGSVNLDSNFPTGNYIVKVKNSTHLQRRVGGIISIGSSQATILPTVTLITGDANNDNVINILDYNMLIGCYSDLLAAPSCDEQKKLVTDMDDDGNVNQTDYNLFLREITVQNGD